MQNEVTVSCYDQASYSFWASGQNVTHYYAKMEEYTLTQEMH